MPLTKDAGVEAAGTRRAHRGPALVPQTATGHLFKIRGGPVVIERIVGRCTTAGSATATNAKLTVTPTVGSAVDICANVAITSIAADTIFTITGTLANAGVLTADGAVIAQANAVYAKAGYLDMITSASNATAKLEWEILYRPLRPGARVVPATP